MHGRPREYKNHLKDPKAQESYRKKVDAIRNGTALVLELRRSRRYDGDAMDASAKLLKVVPEIYTIWNYRREALAPAFEAGGDAAQKASDGELALTQACLADNPKSYSTWHHRKWVVLKGFANLDAELKLIGKALEADQRNFHAWNYRQFLVKLLKRSPEEELEYADERVVTDFSNYSAWHYRTILLNRMYCSTREESDGLEGQCAEDVAGTKSASSVPDNTPATLGAFVGSASQAKPVSIEVLDDEYDIVHEAFATDGGDQSPWMYYRWLVGNSLAHLETAASAEAKEEAEAVLRSVLQREIERLQRDHLQDCPDAKWPLLTVARLKEAQARLKLYDEGDSGESILEEVQGIYKRLMQLDPMRKGFYQDALEGKAFVVVQALGTV